MTLTEAKEAVMGLAHETKDAGWSTRIERDSWPPAHSENSAEIQVTKDGEIIVHVTLANVSMGHGEPPHDQPAILERHMVELGMDGKLEAAADERDEDWQALADAIPALRQALRS